MTKHQDESPADEERLLDLLVDGELDDARRRELLLKLENTPGGWRNCALAFLEAQSWRQELGAVVGEKPATAPRTTAVRSTGRWSRTLIGTAALAASLALAFALGSWYRGGQGVNDPRSPGEDLVQDGGKSPASVAADDPALRQLLDADGYMTLALGGVADGESEHVRVPVAKEGFDPTKWEQPVELPRDLLAELQSNGQTVRQQRRYFPVPLPDGRSIIVPMDELQIVPVNRTFQ